MAGSKPAKPGKLATGDEEVEPLKIQNLGDMAQIKRVLDETAVAAVLDLGYDEKHLASDLKIVLGLFAVGLALAAQFYPKPYPENKVALFACVAGYVVLNVLLQLITSFTENGVILFTKPNPGAGASIVEKKGLAVKLVMKRFDERCTIFIMRVDTRKDDHPDTVKETVKVENFIYDDGVVAEEKFREVVHELVQRFEKGEGKKEH